MLYRIESHQNHQPMACFWDLHAVGVVAQHVELQVFVPVSEDDEELIGRRLDRRQRSSLRHHLSIQPQACFGRDQLPFDEVAGRVVLQPRQGHGCSPHHALWLLRHPQNTSRGHRCLRIPQIGSPSAIRLRIAVRQRGLSQTRRAAFGPGASRRRVLRFGQIKVFGWRRTAVLHFQTVGSLTAGVGMVREAESVAGERRRPLQLVHGDIYGLAQGSVQDEGTAGELQRHLQQSRVKFRSVK